MPVDSIVAVMAHRGSLFAADLPLRDPAIINLARSVRVEGMKRVALASDVLKLAGGPDSPRPRPGGQRGAAFRGLHGFCSNKDAAAARPVSKNARRAGLTLAAPSTFRCCGESEGERGRSSAKEALPVHEERVVFPRPRTEIDHERIGGADRASARVAVYTAC